MHTFTASDGTTFDYNSDLSGNIKFGGEGTRSYGSIPGPALREFLADLIRSNRITALEQADIDELLR